MEWRKLLPGAAGGFILLITQVPFESAKSNVASWISGVGLDRVVNVLPSNVDLWLEVVGVVLISLSIVWLAYKPVLNAVRKLRWPSRSRQLVESMWELNFNPAFRGGTKQISFLRDGSIGLGRNQKEYRWILSGNSLEIWRESGLLQNKFIYDENSRRWVSGSAPNPDGIVGQYIQMK